MQYVMTKPYADGVPTPYRDQVHLYPTTVHGPDYSRPVFTFPYVLTPLQAHAMEGLGDDAAGDWSWQDVYVAAALAGVGAALGGLVLGVLVAEPLLGLQRDHSLEGEARAGATIAGAVAGAALLAAFAPALARKRATADQAVQEGTP